MDTTQTTRSSRSAPATIATTTAALLGLLLLTGCSATEQRAASSTTTGAPTQPGLALAACMRDRGYEFPDPDGSDTLGMSIPDGVDPTQWNEDFDACAAGSGSEGQAKEYTGGGGDLARARAACIREHGYEDFPDDTEQQSSYTPGDRTAFDAVAQQCDREASGDRGEDEDGGQE